ncbi:hypothetical protein PE067_14070 [Paracoccus sp. DMF-8]|uniref:hypothetical protein n=1 Tax=Paracoccus sp. DMF-8 TaxID=3019445 RepID=UPI0023E88E8F|nr:hypothetical protein [Paracoccus sp. DMF-8]MDF3607162.1 hypothetical protein [Paracoccus sp. DMF-8]
MRSSSCILDSIRAARDVIYLESRYFAADSITQAIHARLQEPDGQVVVISPEHGAERDRGSGHTPQPDAARSLRQPIPMGAS